MRLIPIVAVLALMSTAAAAADQSAQEPAPTPDWYSVQVLVFRYTGPDAAQGETWPASVPRPSLKGAVYPAAAGTAPYARLAAAAAPIAQAQAKLSSAGGYAPVAEIGWRQPGPDANAARPVSLTPLPASAPAPQSGPAPESFGAAAAGPGPVVRAGAAPPRVDGTVTLAVANKKPHIAVNLRLCEPPPPGLQIQAPVAATASSTAPAGSSAAFALAATTVPAPETGTRALATAPARQCFAMRQQRQVTPGQLEYFDNPAFGVLVLVNPVTPPAGAATAPQAANGPGKSPARDFP